MKRRLRDCRIIGFRRDNAGRFSNVYMIRECKYCHAMLEVPSNEVSNEVTKKGEYHEYINCLNCNGKVIVI